MARGRERDADAAATREGTEQPWPGRADGAPGSHLAEALLAIVAGGEDGSGTAASAADWALDRAAHASRARP